MPSTAHSAPLRIELTATLCALHNQSHTSGSGPIQRTMPGIPMFLLIPITQRAIPTHPKWPTITCFNLKGRKGPSPAEKLMLGLNARHRCLPDDIQKQPTWTLYFVEDECPSSLLPPPSLPLTRSTKKYTEVIQKIMCGEDEKKLRIGNWNCNCCWQ